MRTYLECIPCFFRQALEGSRRAGLSVKKQKKVLDGFAALIPKSSLKLPPPQIARAGYSILNKYSSIPDPYKKIKRESNRLALRLLGKLKNKVDRSKDSLLAAVELAIAGNIIDFGVKNRLNIKEELKRLTAEKVKAKRRNQIFRYPAFKKSLKRAKSILYLADNAGEVVFDRILIEEIKNKYPEKIIFYAVKEKPIINDALLEDALFCGIDRVARIISNGADAPGTILSLCSLDFKKIYKSADMVISKGQGNFESLSKAKKKIFFLFMVKCPVVAREVKGRMGDYVLLYNKA